MARLGRTNLEVYRLGLGGIPLIKLSPEEARSIIDASLAGGIDFADTAEGYGDSEQKLARFLRHDRERKVIATKSPHRSAAEMAAAIDRSLGRLGTDYIDLYQVHSLKTRQELDRVLAPGGALEALKQAQRDGKVRFIGVTGHRPSVLTEAVRTGLFDTVMTAVNVVDRESEAELMPLARQLDVGIIAMKPVCGGTLDDPGLGIRFSLDSAVDAVLVGMKSLAEVEANLKTARAFNPLTEAERDELLENARQLGDGFCRRCEYCQPCPEGLNIPRILWMANYHRRYAARDPWIEDEYRALDATAASCQECAECEGKCPYDLPIRRMLKDAHRELTPPASLVVKRGLKRMAKKVLRLRKDIG
ncbi:MAG: aldo/keto reductase [Thermoleophilia bacterium]